MKQSWRNSWQFCFRNSGTELLEVVSKVVSKMGSSDLLVRLRRNKELIVEDIRHLNSDAYEIVTRMRSLSKWGVKKEAGEATWT